MRNVYSIKHRKDVEDFFFEKFFNIDGIYIIEKFPKRIYGFKDNGKRWVWEMDFRNEQLEIVWENFGEVLRFDFNSKIEICLEILYKILDIKLGYSYVVEEESWWKAYRGYEIIKIFDKPTKEKLIEISKYIR